MFKNTKLTVTGMNCAHCEKKLVEAISKLEGVKNIKASAKNNSLIFNCNEENTIIEKIKETITEVGFKVN